MKFMFSGIALLSVLLFGYLYLQQPESDSNGEVRNQAGQSEDAPQIPNWEAISRQSSQQIKESLESFRKRDDHPFFEMTFVGDYISDKPINETLKNGDEQAHRPIPDKALSWACSIFASFDNSGSAIYGRNFDWDHNPAMLLHTHPEDGYASVSIVDISYLGFQKDDPKFKTADGRKALLYAPMIPFDGMNEHGLTIGMAAVGDADVPKDNNKKSVGGLQIIRMMLDHAKNVDEALEIFQKHNIVMLGGPNIHYLLADPSGKSVLIELKSGKINLIHGNGKWQSATNFYQTDEEHPLKQCHRFAKIEEKMSKFDGKLTATDTLQLLKGVQQPSTQWSAVYDMAARKVEVALGRNFDNPRQFSIKQKSD